jgi:hypothetical protein
MGLQLNGTGYWDQMYDIDTVEHDIGMTGHRTHITARAKLGGGGGGTTSEGDVATNAASDPGNAEAPGP